MTLLSVRDLIKGYEGVDLLRGVSLVLDEGARVGLVGANASGKSTLLKILAGELEPDSGERVARRDLRLGYLTQSPELPDLPVREVVRGGLAGRDEVVAEIERVHAELAGDALDAQRMKSLLARQSRLDEQLESLGGYDVEHRVEEVVKHLGLLNADARCGSLSGGERRRVALARLLVDRPDLMLLDEPTNHLDAVVIDWLEDFLLESRTPFLMVTHDRYFLDRVVDRIVELDRGTMYEYTGGYADYLAARAQRLASEDSAESSRQNLLRRETAWMRRGPPARSTKAKARIQRFNDLVDAAPEDDSGELEFSIPPGPRLGTKVIRAAGIKKSYGDRLIVPALDLELHNGERLGIIGPNGAGKTTLLRMLTDRLEPDQGKLELGETVAFSIVDQHREGLDPTKSVVEEVAGNSDHVVVDGRTVRVEGFLEKLLFSGKRKHTTISSLSGGEQNRVLLAKLLIQGGNVLVLDEPTNDLDLDTLRRLEEALMAFPGSAIVVSHDRYFLDRVATRVLYLDGEGHARLHAGAVSDLLADIAKARSESDAVARSASKPKAAAASSTTSAQKKVRLSNWETRELAELPAQLETAESELEALDARLADPALYRGPKAEADDLRARREETAKRVETLFTRWEELEAKTGS